MRGRWHRRENLMRKVGDEGDMSEKKERKKERKKDTVTELENNNVK